MQQSCPVFFDIGDQAETCAQLFYVKEKNANKGGKN